MKRLKMVGIVALVALTGGLLSPPTATAQTLAEALVATYENNPTLLAARAELRAVNEGVAQANSAWKPSVQIDGSIGASTTRNEPGLDRFESTQSKSVSLTVQQPIYHGGTIDAEIEAAEAVVIAQRALLRDAEQTVLLAAVTSYMDVWRSQAVLDLSIQNEERLRRQRDASLERFDVGELTRTDVAQAEARLAGAAAQRVTAEGELKSAIATFVQVTGLPATSISQAPPVQGIPGSEEQAVQQATESAPEVNAAQALSSAALATVRARLGDIMPHIDLVGVLSYRNDVTFDSTESRSAQILAQVSIPIYQQGLTSSQIREAKQQANRRRLLLDEALRNAEQAAVEAWQSLVSAQAQITSFEAQVAASNIALDGVTQENTVGARTVLDILDAEQEVLDAKVSLVRAQRDEVVASFQLLAATGRLTASALNLPVAIYDPQVDYEAVRNAWFGFDAPSVE